MKHIVKIYTNDPFHKRKFEFLLNYKGSFIAHRLSGPACECLDGYKFWRIKGFSINTRLFNEAVARYKEGDNFNEFIWW